MSDKDSEGAYQEGRWEFDEKVAGCFDDMLKRSIPQYEVMRDLCFRIGRGFVKAGTVVMDIGCSRGGSLAKFVDADEFSGTASRVNFVGLEVSEPMLAAATERFRDDDRVRIMRADLREGTLPRYKCSLIMAILTVQFVPIEYRHRLVKSVHDRISDGGAFVMVEKVLGNTSRINHRMVREYYDLKKENGYSDDQIERKRLSLEGVLVPITARWNEDLLRETGFRQVDCFWRSLNFAGWIAIK